MSRFRFVLAVVGAAWAPSPGHAEPAIRFAEDRVVATGLSAGGDAVVFGVSRESLPWTTAVASRAELIPDQDGDGAVEYLPGGGLASRSVWAVVDVSSGEWTVAAPSDSPAREVPFDPAQRVGRGPQGRLSRLLDERPSLEVIVVRPNVGAWWISVSDGGPTDDDLDNDGRLRVPLDAATNLSGGPPALRRLSANDVVIGIDPERLEHFAFRFANGGN